MHKYFFLVFLEEEYIILIEFFYIFNKCAKVKSWILLQEREREREGAASIFRMIILFLFLDWSLFIIEYIIYEIGLGSM